MERKRKLIVLANLAKPIEKTWSGTTWSVANALKEFYDVEFRDLHRGRFLGTLSRFAHIPYLGAVFGWLYDTCHQLKANYILRKDKGLPVLEVPDDIILWNNPYFIYADMSYEAGQQMKFHMHDNPWMHPCADNTMRCQSELRRKLRIQKRRYEKAFCTFFMGEWVERLMNDSEKFPNCRFAFAGGGITQALETFATERKTVAP